jgi:hypothetical protein
MLALALDFCDLVNMFFYPGYCSMPSAIINAADEGDFVKVRQMLMDGSGKSTDTGEQGLTLLHFAVRLGELSNVKWLIGENWVSVSVKDSYNATAILHAVLQGCYRIAQWLLEEGGASISDRHVSGETVWERFEIDLPGDWIIDVDADRSSLLKVMVMLADAPDFFIADVLLQDAKICKRGKQFRAQLPSYLEQQQAAVVTHCPLPGVLQSIVVAYATTTPEDMWADGLRVQAPRAKRGHKADAHPLRRSLRLRQN